MKVFQLQDRPHTVHNTPIIQGHNPLRIETNTDVRMSTVNIAA